MIVNNAEAQVPLDHLPVWQSNIVTTGREVALCDIEKDGDLDLVIANDSPDNTIQIYKNVGPFFEYEPSWYTDCFVAVGVNLGDVDNDGDLDLAVAAYQHCYLYKNTGDSLERTPSWTSSFESWSFSWVGWGDVDNDGDLDLAATGLFIYPRIYYNNDGILGTLPSWQAIDYNIDNAGSWGDVDDDGDLDLAVGALNLLMPTRVYYNNSGFLENIASWTSPYPLTCGLSWGDIDGDGKIDLAGSCGYALTDTFNVVWLNQGDSLESIPSWQSENYAMGVRSALGDVDNDSDLDLAVAVYDSSQDIVYLNTDGIFSSSPDWYSSTDYNSWGIAWGDIDADGIVSSIDTLVGNGFRKLYYFGNKRIPIHSLDSIVVDGIILPQSDYCYDISSGWISLKDAPSNGDMILIHYKYSTDLDLAISYSREACALFQNTNVGIEEIDDRIAVSDLNVFPNPFSRNTTFEYTTNTEKCYIEIFDISGCKVNTLKNGDKFGRIQRNFWNGTDFSSKKLPSGIYFCQLVSQHMPLDRVKVILLK
ncbi:hypothetical protein AMJ52_00255 [candidate division TA06 bacterium DG_78]|uniref:Uncharacterized protein n=1 Tax=candidate division TA06 bacterium DG_78 TaxID=1703772 RepID=A0A0S7YIE2_UNCT6|nr:MAG: hypothetical protein AMJ52_00255 [candidate division TA06 bacterium DG_78]